jgi:hypothetical protein
VADQLLPKARDKKDLRLHIRNIIALYKAKSAGKNTKIPRLQASATSR